MYACVDVHYLPNDEARAACIVFPDPVCDMIAWEGTTLVKGVAPYIPGQFYLRELPCLKAILALAPAFDTVFVDSYVQLGSSPGLGQHLYEDLEEKVAVIGVAKTPFAGAPSTQVIRNGTRPLYVTAIGKPLVEAVEMLDQMHGPYRLPTLLKRVDSLCRGQVVPRRQS
jgi:deoxyribonuclease V